MNKINRITLASVAFCAFFVPLKSQEIETFSLGIRLGIPVGTLKDRNGYNLESKTGIGFDIQGGFHVFGSDAIEYGLHTMGFPENTSTLNHEKYKNDARLIYGRIAYSLSLNDEYKLRGIIGINYGKYSSFHSKQYIYTTPDGVIETWGTETLEDTSCSGVYLGIRRPLNSFMSFEVGFNSIKGDAKKIGHTSLQWADVGVKFIW